ncbi:MAG: LacI family DNA-binding transcriptional regulator [Opitutaceae bacterium]|jgi:LacI family transcriptional regulator
MKTNQTPQKNKKQAAQKIPKAKRPAEATGSMIKIVEFARLAKVSMATVSRVFNHHPSIRPELRRHVLSVAQAHGYRPRLSLKQKNVVVVTPYHPVWPVHSCVDMILMALTQEMPRRGFRLEILPADNLSRLADIQFCAAVAIGTEPSDFADWPDRFPVPLVVLDRERKTGSPLLFTIRSDEAQGMDLAVGHLHERGCRQIGCIIHGSPGTGNADQRHAGIQRALAARGLPHDESLILFSGDGDGKYTELIGKLLKRGVDALFCPGGNAGIIALHAFSLYNRKVPDDISLIASEQTSFSDYTVPPLTTISPDYSAMAAATADAIEAYLAGRAPVSHTVLPYGLIKRESVSLRPSGIK